MKKYQWIVWILYNVAAAEVVFTVYICFSSFSGLVLFFSFTLYTVLIIQDFKLEMWFTALCLYIFCLSISHQQDARSSSYYKKLNKILKSKTTSTIPLKESSLQCLGKQNVFTSAEEELAYSETFATRKAQRNFCLYNLLI